MADDGTLPLTTLMRCAKWLDGTVQTALEYHPTLSDTVELVFIGAFLTCFSRLVGGSHIKPPGDFSVVFAATAKGHVAPNAIPSLQHLDRKLSRYVLQQCMVLTMAHAVPAASKQSSGLARRSTSPAQTTSPPAFKKSGSTSRLSAQITMSGCGLHNVAAACLCSHRVGCVSRVQCLTNAPSISPSQARSAIPCKLCRHALFSLH